MLTPALLARILSAPTPRIEVRNGLRILLRDENILMPLPPASAPLAVGLVLERLSPDARLDYLIAMLRLRTPDRIEPSDIVEIEEALLRAPHRDLSP